ncbi:hypothetical protein E4K72_12625 [Oxalobacteraceae bacterium OM1]|nr:hypothetical protein E4K72_12625 [Oxalobacteraceae bacterium OM1]
MVYHDPAVLHLVAHGLDRHGYVVFRYAEPETAMAALPTIEPDVLLIEAGPYLRLHALLGQAARSAFPDVKIVGIGRQSDAELAARVQFDAIHRSSFTAEGLHRTIQRLLAL